VLTDCSVILAANWAGDSLGSKRVGVDPPARKVDPGVGRVVPDDEGLGETGSGEILRRGRENPDGDVLADPVGKQGGKGVEVGIRVAGEGDGLADVAGGEADVLKQPGMAAAVVLERITDGRDDAVLRPALAAAEREDGFRRSGGRRTQQGQQHRRQRRDDSVSQAHVPPPICERR
jgi:hypothetical protein